MTLILSFGELLSVGQAVSKYPLISQRMRQLAGLLIQLRETANMPHASLQSFLKPECSDTVIKAVLVVAKFEESAGNATARLSVPSLALKIGHSLRKCSTLLVNKALREKDEALEREAQSFVRLLDSESQHRVSSIALRTMKDDK